MKIIGIDIGTTGICGVALSEDGTLLRSYTENSSAFIDTGKDYERVQDVNVIMEVATRILRSLYDEFEGDILAIGVTGQMHGIVYVNENGEAVSNLINWQDKRADQRLDGGNSVSEDIFTITKECVPTGYGMATHYYNIKKGLVPHNAVALCSIMDLFAMKICGINKPITHTSVASSFGLFDVKKGKFKEEKLSLLGINSEFLPSVTKKNAIIGECRGIPVSVPIGDNQASFLGSSSDGNALLVNIGTGSQVCAVTDYKELYGDIELRPLIEEKYLACGSALCGGYAYNLLESFFRSYTASAGMESASQYEIMNKLAREAYEKGIECPSVDVSFLGKRNDPSAKGSINGLDSKNFTPSALVLGVLKGMCSELYGLYKSFNENKTHIVASGGAIEKIDVLKNLIADCFGMEVNVSIAKEEAAMGAALFSALSVGADDLL